MKNNSDRKSAIISAIIILATIAATLILTSFKERRETADTQTSIDNYLAYTPVSDADAPILSANEFEVKEYPQDTNPAQSANVAVFGNEVGE